MQEVKQRNKTVDLLRGTAALCMILGHSFIVYPVDISAVPWCAAVRDVIYMFHMELFFLLSGWVYKCACYGTYVRKKIRRMLIPYLFFGSVSLVLHIVAGSSVNGNTTLSEGLVDLVFYGGDYWFIYTLLIMSLIYPLAEKLLRKPVRKLIVMAALLCLDGLAEFRNVFFFNTALHYWPYFLLGTLIGAGGISEKISGAPRKLLLFAVLGFACAAALHPLMPECVMPTVAFVRAIAFSAALYAVFIMLDGKTGALWKRTERLLLDASRYSLQLYLFNGYIMVAARIFLCSILRITAPAVIVLSIFLANWIITCFVCKKILPGSAVLRCLCGM